MIWIRGRLYGLALTRCATVGIGVMKALIGYGSGVSASRPHDLLVLCPNWLLDNAPTRV